MSEIKAWQVSARLYMAFGVVIVTAIASQGASYLQQKRADAVLKTVTEVELAHLQQVYEVQNLATGVTARGVSENL